MWEGFMECWGQGLLVFLEAPGSKGAPGVIINAGPGRCPRPRGQCLEGPCGTSPCLFCSHRDSWDLLRQKAGRWQDSPH